MTEVSEGLKKEDSRLPCHAWGIECMHCDCGSLLLDTKGMMCVFLAKGDALQACESAGIDPKHVVEVKIAKTIR